METTLVAVRISKRAMKTVNSGRSIPEMEMYFISILPSLIAC